MKISFDGARRNLANAYNGLAERYEFCNFDCEEDKRVFVCKINELQSAVGGLLCMYDPECKDDCNDF